MKSGFKTIKPIGGVRDKRHGTLGGYAYWGCRCEKCTEANRVAGKISRAEKLANLQPGDHGKAYTYICGCRCAPCRVAGYEERHRKLSKPARRTKKVKLNNLA